MSNITELKHESTLSAIAENPDSKANKNLFAVIVDISEPIKNSNGSNFILRLKVVDPSFNYKAKIENPALTFHKFIHVHLYIEDTKDVPKIESVGTIIRLRRFSYKISKHGDIIGNEVKFSNWLIYSGQVGDSQKSISHKNITNNKNRVLTKYEEGRLSDLREWISDFFFKHSLLYITWWTSWKSVNDDKNKLKQKHEKVDLILKCVSFNNKEGKLYLVDKDSTNFELAIGVRSGIQAGEYIKLRCVDILPLKASATSRQISLNSLSSCLKIPANFCDVNQFNKGEKKSPKKGTSDALPFLGDYTVVEDKNKKIKVVTANKKPKSFESKSVKDLTSILNDATKNQGQKYLLNGQIEGYASTSPSDIFKRMLIESKKVVDLKSKDGKDKKSKVIYNLVFKVKDDLNSNDQPANIYFVSQEYGTNVFDSWKILPSVDDNDEWKNIKDSKFTEFEKKLNSLCSADKKVNFIVEVAIAKNGKGFLRLVDTVFVN